MEDEYEALVLTNLSTLSEACIARAFIDVQLSTRLNLHYLHFNSLRWPQIQGDIFQQWLDDKTVIEATGLLPDSAHHGIRDLTFLKPLLCV